MILIQNHRIHIGQARPAIILTAIPARTADIGIRIGIAIADISNPLIRKVALNHHRLMKPARLKPARIMAYHRVRRVQTVMIAKFKIRIARWATQNIK